MEGAWSLMKTLDPLLELYKKGEWTINRKDEEGKTLLHFAVIEDREDLVDLLIKEKAEILPDSYGITPVHLTKLLKRSNRLATTEEQSILIYRNRDEKVHSMSILEFEERLEMRYYNSLIFDDSKTIYRVAKKCAHKLKKPNFKQMNHWTLCLHEKNMELPREHLYYIRWINRYLGYGVFANSNIPANTFIGEYTGIIKKRNNRKNRFNDYVFSYDLCGKSTRWCIDAKHEGNFTRFLNHSDQPNLTSRWIIKDGITHIILYSNRFIPIGQQLTYCYGPWYWKSRSAPSPL